MQVFETTIRGLGGLLSAHLFATQALPGLPRLPGRPAYGGELLLLATDLGRRLLPALTLSPTGIPYPRINLRYGLPHGVKNPAYYNRPPRPARGGGSGGGKGGGDNGNYDDGDDNGYGNGNDGAAREHASQKHWRHATAEPETPDEETTETCTAGAGSLVLEFTTLARLTGHAAFESAARGAFDAIWRRRSAIGLVGAGVDAESGAWTGANAGLGAGADSFFEYAFKGYVLLAGHAADEAYYLAVWEASRAALQRHVLVREPAAWWTNVHVNTGARLAGGAWFDSLGGFWAGTLAGAGATAALPDGLELAVRGHLVYTALWARYGALPERWSPRAGAIEGGLTWYPGRPELAESTYQLFRATRDPFWLHVGEMVLRDLVRRCRAGCGWAGLQDVRTGARQDRMESFWLSETWKYLFLLFDDAHPLHRLDAPWVFSTEGHPLILPRTPAPSAAAPSAAASSAATAVTSAPASAATTVVEAVPPRTCAVPPAATGFFSPVASRTDLFHAAVLARLHEHPPPGPSSPYYPATLPPHLVPPNATCAPVPSRDALDLVFPEGYAGPGAVAVSTLLSRFAPRIQRVADGVRILSLDALRLRLTAAVAAPAPAAAAAAAAAPAHAHAYASDGGDDDVDGDSSHMRISKVAGVHLGREETVYIDRALIAGIRDENFAVFARNEVVDLLLTLSPSLSSSSPSLSSSLSLGPDDGGPGGEPGGDAGYLQDLLAKLHDLLSLDPDLHLSTTTNTFTTTTTTTTAVGVQMGITIQAVISHGRGAVPPVDIPAGAVYVADSQACAGILPRRAGASPVVVLRRGGCTFAEKISHVPDSPIVKLVVVEDYPGAAAGQVPRVDGQQLNAWGRPRNNPVPLVMVPGRGGDGGCGGGEGGGGRGVDWARVAEVAVRTRVGVRVMGREVRGLDVT